MKLRIEKTENRFDELSGTNRLRFLRLLTWIDQQLKAMEDF